MDDHSASTQPSIGVVVVNWNGWRNTLESYESLAACDYKNWTLYIVDNASSDGSAQMIREHIPDAVLIESDTNLGFAGGCNLGISKVAALGLDYVYLLNNDATVTADTLNQLVSASAALEDRAILGSVVKFWPSGELQFFGSERSERSGRPHWYRQTANAQLLNSELIETDFVFGAALFAPVKIFEKLGLFDERFFLNFEETDWCYRAAAEGIPRYVVTRSVVHHEGSASLGDARAPMQTYFLSRNRLLFYDKHGSLRGRMTAYLELTRDLASRLKKSLQSSPPPGVPQSAKALILAIRDYTLRRFGDCPPEIRELARRAAAAQAPKLVEVAKPDGDPHWL